MVRGRERSCTIFLAMGLQYVGEKAVGRGRGYSLQDFVVAHVDRGVERTIFLEELRKINSILPQY
jgi:hypothetical protein